MLTNVACDWDCIAGGAEEFNSTRRPKGVPHDHILCYKISKEALVEILDRYPGHRQFIIMRALVRRSYFNKVKADNLQVILFRMKKWTFSRIAAFLEHRNEFLSSEESEDEDRNN